MTETRTTSSTGGQKGVKLARFDLIPAGPLRELAEHYGVGASKYADNQWRKGYEWSKSIAAIGRHFNDFMAGKDYDVCSNDPEGCSHVDTEGNPFVAVREDACFNHTGSHHMAAVAWHSFLLLEFKDAHPEHDDRYKPLEIIGHLGGHPVKLDPAFDKFPADPWEGQFDRPDNPYSVAEELARTLAKMVDLQPDQAIKVEWGEPTKPTLENKADLDELLQEYVDRRD